MYLPVLLRLALYYITFFPALQCLGGDKAVTVSKAEKVALALCAIFVVFCAGWFAGGLRRDGSYTVTSDALFPADATDAPTPRPTFVSDVPVDLNTAALDDLTALPGIGEAKAQAILDYRREHGPFRRVEDVMKVKGIGEGIFQQLEPYITLTPEGGQTP